MQKSKSKSKGGKRDGAGRPTLSNGERRVALPARVHPSTMDALKSIAGENGASVGSVVDEMTSAHVLQLHANAGPPDLSGKKGKKQLTEERQRHAIGVLSKLFSDGTFEREELKHFLTLGYLAPTDTQAGTNIPNAYIA